MGLLNWLFGRKKVKRWKGKPLYRIGKEPYWKGTRVSDDQFEWVRQNPEELRQYNYWVRKSNRRLKVRRRRWNYI